MKLVQERAEGGGGGGGGRGISHTAPPKIC